MALLVGSGTSLGGLTGGAAVARLLVVVSGNTSGLFQSLSGATKGIEGFNKNAGALGSALTRTLTLPILALGGVAIAAASQFQSALGRIAGLTPILEDTGLTIDQIGEKLLRMSVVTGTSATELANALYFAGSAGLDAAVALDVVELSAKGAAIGMGDAADISKVLIFALNNYEDEGLTAASAMDTLTAAIREGTAEPNELAIALGRVIPVAKEAGISFSELVGSVAALTNLGVPTRVATTALRALFGQLLAPTIQATELLNQLGITAQELRDRLALGPVAAFDLLIDATNGEVDALHDIIPQIRGFTAFLGLTGEQAQRVTEIFLATKNSTGALDRAFKIIAKTPAFKFQKALQQLNVAAIKFGSKAMPIFLAFVDVLNDVGKALAGLPDVAQYAIIAFLGIGAAIGPLLKLYSSLTAAGAGLFKNAGAIASGFAAMGFAAGLAGANLNSMVSDGANLMNTMGTLVGTLLAVKLAMTGLQVAANAGAFGVNALSLAFVSMSPAMITAIAVGIGLLVTAIGAIAGAAGRTQREMNQLAESANNISKTGGSVRKFLQGLENREAADNIREVAQGLRLLDEPLNKVLPRLTKGLGFDLVNTLERMGDAFAKNDFEQEAADAQRFADALGPAIDNGEDMGAALKRAGLSSAELFELFDRGKSTLGALGIGKLAGEAEDLALEVGHLQEAWRTYNRDTQDTIAATVANEDAIAALAKKYNVSESTIRDSLDRYTSGVALMDQKTEEEWSHAAGLVDEKTGEMIGAQAEAAAATEQMAADITSELRSAFSVFGELPEQFAKPMDKLLGHADAMKDVLIGQVTDIRTLFERGVPAGLIEQILAEGPNAAKRFANASDAELQRLVRIYQVSLGAMDDEILAEIVHQERKGGSMVERFTTSILRRKTLPATAAREIVQLMTDAFIAGKIEPGAFRLVQNFANAVAASNLPKKAAGKIVVAFAKRVSQGREIPKLGTEEGRAFARALADTAGITYNAARDLMVRAQSGIRSKKADLRGETQRNAREAGDAFRAPTALQTAFAAGVQLVQQFVQGMFSNSGAISTATTSLANLAANGLNEKLKGSPKLFSYYLGQDLVTQLKEGVERAAGTTMKRDLSHVLVHPTARIPYVPPSRRGANIDLDVKLDRRRHARELYYEANSQGI